MTEQVGQNSWTFSFDWIIHIIHDFFFVEIFEYVSNSIEMKHLQLE